MQQHQKDNWCMLLWGRGHRVHGTLVENSCHRQCSALKAHQLYVWSRVSILVFSKLTIFSSQHLLDFYKCGLLLFVVRANWPCLSKKGPFEQKGLKHHDYGTSTYSHTLFALHFMEYCLQIPSLMGQAGAWKWQFCFPFLNTNLLFLASLLLQGWFILLGSMDLFRAHIPFKHSQLIWLHTVQK